MKRLPSEAHILLKGFNSHTLLKYQIKIFLSQSNKYKSFTIEKTNNLKFQNSKKNGQKKNG